MSHDDPNEHDQKLAQFLMLNQPEVPSAPSGELKRLQRALKKGSSKQNRAFWFFPRAAAAMGGVMAAAVLALVVYDGKVVERESRSSQNQEDLVVLVSFAADTMNEVVDAEWSSEEYAWVALTEQ